MAVVVADAGPLHYLLLIEAIGLLPAIFGRVTVPEPVLAELSHPNVPAAVRAWAAALPDWVTAVRAPEMDDPALSRLGAGERAALLLAAALPAGLLLMDDRAAVGLARARGFGVVGTLGILDLAARRGMLDLPAAIARLKATNLRYRPDLLDGLLARHAGEGRR